MLGDPAEAEDAAQEAFLRAWQAAARFDPDRARFSTWLHRIVLNIAIDREALATRIMENTATPTGRRSSS